jgi:hypothetical protein
MRIAATSILITMLVALSASVAFAQGSSPSAQGYDRELGVIGEIEQVEPPASNNTPSSSASTPPQAAEEGDLPFTGLELGLVALMGVALLGTGVALRRVSRRGDTPTA